MQVQDVMQTKVVTVFPDATVSQAAKIMTDNRVSGLPVVEKTGGLAGLISEGDLLDRTEFGGEASRSWWLDLFGKGETAADFIHSHSKLVRDVMTKSVETIAPTASLADAAHQLEAHGFKRLPVVLKGKLIGVVSRADLVRALASLAPKLPQTAAGDSALRAAVQKAIAEAPALSGVQATVLVRDGVVELWGLATTTDVVAAARVAAEAVPGVKQVENNITLFPSAYYG